MGKEMAVSNLKCNTLSQSKARFFVARDIRSLMKPIMKQSKSMALPLIVFLILELPSRPSHAAIVEEMLVGAALSDVLGTKVEDLKDSFEQSGDYLTGKAALEASRLIIQIQDAYRNELGRTVGEIDGLLKRLNDIDALIDDARNSAGDVAERLDKLQLRSEQLLANTPLAEDGPYVSSIKPAIFVPGEQYSFIVSGVDMHEIKLITPEGKQPAQVTRHDNTSFNVIIPGGWFSPSDNRLSIESVKVSLIGDRHWWGLRKKLDTEFSIGLLPRVLGAISYDGDYSLYAPKTRLVSINPGRFKGSNTERRKVVLPTGAGWTVDTDSPVTIRQSGADNGECVSKPHEINEAGITVAAKLKRRPPIFLKLPFGGDGFVTCTVSFTEKKMEGHLTPFEGEALLKWDSAVSIVLPDSGASPHFKIKLFDGEIHHATGSEVHKYFKIKREGRYVIFSPAPPSRF